MLWKDGALLVYITLLRCWEFARALQKIEKPGSRFCEQQQGPLKGPVALLTPLRVRRFTEAGLLICWRPCLLVRTWYCSEMGCRAGRWSIF